MGHEGLVLPRGQSGAGAGMHFVLASFTTQQAALACSFAYGSAIDAARQITASGIRSQLRLRDWKQLQIAALAARQKTNYSEAELWLQQFLSTIGWQHGLGHAVIALYMVIRYTR